jgi:hypothetical protein
LILKTVNMDGGRKQSIVQVTHSDNVLHVEDSKIRKMSVANPEFARVTHDAKGGVAREKNMTFTQAIKLYPKAVGWSLLLSTAIVMEGYDTALLGNFYAFPQFRQRYGELVEGSDPPSYQVRNAHWSREAIVNICRFLLLGRAVFPTVPKSEKS